MACALAAVIVHAGWVATKRNEGDLRVYHDTVARLPAGLDIYQRRESARPDEPTGFIYPLPFALAFVPFTTLPFPVLRAVWAFLMGMAALRSFALAVRLAYPEGASAWVRAGPAPIGRAVSLVLGAAVPLRFALSDIQHGQVNVLVVWLALEGVAFAERRAADEPGLRRDDARAGALLAAAAAIKLTPGLLIAGYLLARRWRLVGWAVAMSALLVLVAPALVLGPVETLDAMRRFVTEVTPWNARQHAFVGNNASLSGLVHRLLVGTADAGQQPRPMLLALAPDTGRALATAVSAAVFLTTLLVTTRLQGVMRSAFLFAAIPLISPVAWKPHLVSLTLPALIGARAAIETGSRPVQLALAVAAVALLSGREVVGRDLADLATRWGATTTGIAALALGLALAGWRRADLAAAGQSLERAALPRAPD